MKRLFPIRVFAITQLFSVALLLAVPAFAQPAPKAELVVAAAASLREALTEIGGSYQKQYPNVKLNFNFGSSGTLQKQIEQGAPIDVFVAAADQNMDELASKKLIDTATRRNLAGNILVLIVPKDSKVKPRRFQDVASPKITHVAIGGPTVPAGMRAEEVFTNLGIWDKVLTKAVRGKDVREVLTQVELANVEAGVVYGTDAAVSDKVRVAAVAKAALHKPIRYPVAVVSDSKQKAEAGNFVRYLSTSFAKKILKRYKFILAKN